MNAPLENIGKMSQKNLVERLQVATQRVRICNKLYLVLD